MHHFRVISVKYVYLHTPQLDIYAVMKLCMLDNAFLGATFVINTFSDQMLPEDIQDHAQIGVISQCPRSGQEENRSNHVTLAQNQNELVVEVIHVRVAN